ncbi:MAG: DUF1360 domain-containing protein [Candidatus Dormibacteraeota bacterium]|nr:DUF1360 domain-containing protein [Candidatus Dormibacteraeota bacterium]MBV9524839.1 DUF1360 domain-containing protein [Candidatus Dormibacteraeota bacterium]
MSETVTAARRTARRNASAATRQAKATTEQYSPKEDRPLGGYAAIMAVYGVCAAGLGGLLLRRRRPAERLNLGDIALLSAATFKVSRLAGADAVASPLRAPFARYKGPGEAPSEVREEVRGSGLRRAVGELVTCPYCLGQWVATAFVGGMIVAPRATRVAAGTLTIAAASDALQLGYSAAARALK